MDTRELTRWFIEGGGFELGQALFQNCPLTKTMKRFMRLLNNRPQFSGRVYRGMTYQFVAGQQNIPTSTTENEVAAAEYARATRTMLIIDVENVPAWKLNISAESEIVLAPCAITETRRTTVNRKNYGEITYIWCDATPIA